MKNKSGPMPDKQAQKREKLILEHMPLVRWCVKNFTMNSRRSDQTITTHEDLVQVGVLGLISAIDRVDPSRGASIETWIRRCVWTSLQKSAWTHEHAVQIPTWTGALSPESQEKARLARDRVALDDIPRPSSNKDLEGQVDLQAAMKQLSTRDRNLLSQRASGQSYVKMSEISGVNYIETRRHTQRALQALAKLMGQSEPRNPNF